MWERTDRQRKGGNFNGADVLRNEPQHIKGNEFRIQPLLISVSFKSSSFLSPAQKRKLIR